MVESSGVRGNKFGRTTAPRIAEALGAQMLGAKTNEALFQGQKITIKCASYGTTSVGVTLKVLDRVDAVLGAFQKKDGSFEVIALPIAQYKAAMYTSYTGPATRLVGRSTFHADGKTILTGLKLTPIHPLESVIKQLQERADSHAIGNLQDLRKDLKGLKHRPAKNTFTSMFTSEDWAYHLGGRTELQFNLGVEGFDEEAQLRHGVAFSIEASKSYPEPELLAHLAPKIRLFNEFLLLHPGDLADFYMWHFDLAKGERSADYPVSPIPADRVTPATFIILGKRQPFADANLEIVLSDFDRLLDLYRFVEGGGQLVPSPLATVFDFVFEAGCAPKTGFTTATLVQQLVDVDLRHNRLQECLDAALSAEYGRNNVKIEVPCGPGNKVDVVVRKPEGFWFYEIKTASTARACIRQALGQLLEYAFWPGNKTAARIVVAGEPPLDTEGQAYLDALARDFRLPLNYLQLPALEERLVGEHVAGIQSPT